jgi:hypothetical protein
MVKIEVCNKEKEIIERMREESVILFLLQVIVILHKFNILVRQKRRHKKAAVKSFEDQLLAVTHTHKHSSRKEGVRETEDIFGEFVFLSLTTFGIGFFLYFGSFDFNLQKWKKKIHFVFFIYI